MKTLKGDGTWPFVAYVDGDDIFVDDCVITCFGGAFDPQDNGKTASGVNTKKFPNIAAVSLPMDLRGRKASAKEHAALDGSPIPRVPWGTTVEVTIGNQTIKFGSGVIDLGPGKQASKPGEPHALDLTPGAAALFQPGVPFRMLATRFAARGSFRIIGGAKFLS